MHLLHTILLMEVALVGGRRGPGMLHRSRRDSSRGFCPSLFPARFWLSNRLPWQPPQWTEPGRDNSGTESLESWSTRRRRTSAAPPRLISLAGSGSARRLRRRRAPAASTPGHRQLPAAPGLPVAAAGSEPAATAARHGRRQLAPHDSVKAKSFARRRYRSDSFAEKPVLAPQHSRPRSARRPSRLPVA